MGSEVVLEVNSRRVADVLIDVREGDEAEDGEAEAGAGGGVEEVGFGAAPGLGVGGKGLEKALREHF